MASHPWIHCILEFSRRNKKVEADIFVAHTHTHSPAGEHALSPTAFHLSRRSPSRPHQPCNGTQPREERHLIPTTWARESHTRALRVDNLDSSGISLIQAPGHQPRAKAKNLLQNHSSLGYDLLSRPCFAPRGLKARPFCKHRKGEVSLGERDHVDFLFSTDRASVWTITPTYVCIYAILRQRLEPSRCSFAGPIHSGGKASRILLVSGLLVRVAKLDQVAMLALLLQSGTLLP